MQTLLACLSTAILLYNAFFCTSLRKVILSLKSFGEPNSLLGEFIIRFPEQSSVYLREHPLVVEKGFNYKGKLIALLMLLPLLIQANGWLWNVLLLIIHLLVTYSLWKIEPSQTLLNHPIVLREFKLCEFKLIPRGFMAIGAPAILCHAFILAQILPAIDFIQIVFWISLPELAIYLAIVWFGSSDWDAARLGNEFRKFKREWHDKIYECPNCYGLDLSCAACSPLRRINK